MDVWPVGQAVKTEASHAFNIGSIPVRVTRQQVPGMSQYVTRSVPYRDIPGTFSFPARARTGKGQAERPMPCFCAADGRFTSETEQAE